jgi:hypothetical protein
MKLIMTLTLAVAAAGSVSGIAAASAFAETEWLVNGVTVTSALAADTAGTLSLDDTAAGIGKITCSELFEGTIGPKESGTITKIVGLEGKTPPLNCSAKACASELAEVTPVNLSWAGSMLDILISGELFWEWMIRGVTGSPGFEVTCTVLGIKVTDTCTGETGGDLTNVSSGVELIFSENAERTPRLTCTLSKEKTGILTGSALVTTTEGTLTVS